MDKSGASIAIPTTRTSLCSILAPREVELRSLAPLVAAGLAVARQKMLHTAVRRGGRIHQGTWRPPFFKDGSSHLIMFLRSLVVFSGAFIIHDRSNCWSPLVTVGHGWLVSLISICCIVSAAGATLWGPRWLAIGLGEMLRPLPF